MNESEQADEPQGSAEEPVEPRRKRDMKWRSRAAWLLVIAAVFVADQLTKALVIAAIYPGRNIRIIDDWLYFTHVKNPGAAFGMFSDLPPGWRELFLGVLGAVALTLVVIYSLRLRTNEWISQLGLHMIFAGAIGNLTDRFVHGAVTDFILFRHGGWSFPAFNIADSAIVIGVSLLLIDTLVSHRGETVRAASSVSHAGGLGAPLESGGADQGIGERGKLDSGENNLTGEEPAPTYVERRSAPEES